MATKRRFELSEGSSDKFWEVEVDGQSMTVTFGRKGTAGQAKEKTFGSAADAQKEADKLVAEKTKKGYAAVGAKAAKPAAKTAEPVEEAPAARKAAAKKTATTSAPAARKAAAAEAAPVATATKSAKRGPPPKAILELLETIAAKEKWLAKQLLAPATPAALATLRALGAPDFLLGLYGAHDGSEAELMGPYQLLPIAEIVGQRAMMNELLAKSPAWQKDGTWSTRWIPFLADGDGQYYAIDPDGSVNDGKPGQVIFYDHEVGPEREVTSFEVFVGLLTNLAKKKLLGQQAREDNEEKVEALTAEAKAVGLPKMSPKELKAALSKLERGEDEPDPSPEEKLAILLPLVKKFGAEEKLWTEVRRAATQLERWPLVIEAAHTAMRLAPRDEKSWQVPELALALHRTGRDAEALAALRKGIEWSSNPNSTRVGLIADGVSPAFREQALRLINEVHPSDQEAWMQLGIESSDPSVRTASFRKVIELVDAMRFGGHFFDARKVAMQRLLEHDRIAGWSPDKRLEALTAFAKRIDKGKNAGLWIEVATLAAELGRWKEADAAAAEGIQHSYESNRYQVAHHRLRALHELGRDADALKVLRDVLTDSNLAGYGMCFVAIPWHAEREADDLARTGAQRAFEARCFALVTELGPDNLEAWQWRAKLTTGAESVAAWERVVAHYVEEEKGAADWDEDDRDDLLQKKAEAVRNLEAARAGR